MDADSAPGLSVDECTAGLRVRVIGAPERTGTIRLAPQLIDGRPYVRVEFDDGGRRNTPVDHLERLPEHLDAISEIEAGRFQGPESLRGNLLHEKLHGRLSEVVYSMDASDTKFLAYQFKPIFKLLESPTNSLLIADEVGLGKTIEAGLIWTELRAREGARTLVVVCPPHLVTKWRNELKRRFGVDAERADAATLREKLEEARVNRTSGYALVATYHSLRPLKGWEDDATGPAAELARALRSWGDEEEPFLDLLVMDEAAIMRNEESQTSKLGALMAPICRHKVYLSATPLHTKARNLFTLLRRLDPDTFPDEQTFVTILDANAPLVALREAILRGRTSREEMLVKLDAAMRYPILAGNKTISDLRSRVAGEANLADPKIRSELAYLSERANLLSYVVTRTRRRDIEKKPVLREVNTLRVPLSEAERSLYNAVTDAVIDYTSTQGIGSGFLTVMPQRQVASCIVAGVRRFKGTQDDGEEVNPDFSWSRQATPAGPLIQHIRSILRGTFDEKELEAKDSKYTKLVGALKEHWRQHPEGKIVLFAFFKPTLRYLSDRLGRDGIFGILLTGDETRDKQETVDEFEKHKGPAILLSSEVGSEGLDLQFASTLVNYDLPWNPMVVEQRIGRIHRIGQEAERIIVINLICEGTVDERIYDRLYDRLDLFRHTLGDLEAVIGPQINDLANDLLSLNLTPEQQAARIDQTAIAMQEVMRLEEELEREASVLAAYGDYVTNRIAAAHARREWITGKDLQAYVLTFFRRVFPATRITGVAADSDLFEIELDPTACHEFEEFLRLNNLRGQTRLATQERRRVRFDHRVFRQSERTVEVIHQAHPFVRFIGHYLRVNRLVQPVAAVAEIPNNLRPDGASPGTYVFVTQRWTVDGIRPYEKLHHEVVSLDDGKPIVDPAVASAIIEIAAALGNDVEEAPQPGDPLLLELAEKVGEIEFGADAAFHRFLGSAERENEDRKQIQLRGVDRFEQRRATALQEVLERHRAAGRKPLVAATEGKLTSLAAKCNAQRTKVTVKRTTGDCATLAAGIIVIAS